MSPFAGIPLGNYAVKPQTGFSSELLDKLVMSRSKVEEWVQHEKAKADKVAEDYRQQLMQEQAKVDTKVTNLLAVQLERGLNMKSEGEENDNSESLAKKKVALEEQRTMLESEVEKLEKERQNREKRVKGESASLLRCVVVDCTVLVLGFLFTWSINKVPLSHV
jgi:hypothetical protein